MSTSENAHDTEGGRRPQNTAGTPRIGTRAELDHLRRMIAEEGVENLRPVTLVCRVLTEDAEAEIRDAWGEVRRGGTLRVIYGLAETAGIALHPMDEDTARANVDATTTLIDDTGVPNHVNSTVFVVAMSEAGGVLDGYGPEQVADEVSHADGEEWAEDDVDLADEDGDVAEADPEDDAEAGDLNGMIVVLNFQRKA